MLAQEAGALAGDAVDHGTRPGDFRAVKLAVPEQRLEAAPNALQAPAIEPHQLLSREKTMAGNVPNEF